jgi:hypothetical protein
LTADFGAAQIMYIRRGYIFDGRGLSWNGQYCQYGDQVTVDYGLIMFLTKHLTEP